MVRFFQRLHRDDGLALIAGLALPLAFAPLSWWPLAVAACALLLWSWEDAAPGRAAWRGLLFGLGSFGAGISWVYISLHSFGDAPLPFAILANLILILAMSLYPAAVGWLAVRLAPRPRAVRRLLLAPAVWGLGEWLRSWLLTGFPWLSLGYSQIDAPLVGLAPVLGVFGVSWAVWLSAGLLVGLLRGPSRQQTSVLAVGLLSLWLGAWGLGLIAWVAPAGEPLQVSLVQGNIAQDRKWRSDQVRGTLTHYTELSLEATPNSDLIIWPESAVPLLYEEAEESFFRPLASYARKTDTDYLIGIIAGSWDDRIFRNGVVSLGGSHGFYYKHHLLPFGEYLPLRRLLAFFRDFVDIPMSDFTPGAAYQEPLRVKGVPVGVSICYEAAFGEQIRRALPEARLLVNVSNDAWFGRSLAPYQHLEIARMRSLETGRPMARATNTGVSALIDARGRVTARSELFKTQVLRGEVQPMTGMTPYGRWGDWGVVAMLAVGVLLGLGLGKGASPVSARSR